MGIAGITETTIAREDAATIDNVVKFAWEDADYETVGSYDSLKCTIEVKSNAY